MLKQIYERKISLGEIFSGSWDIYFKRFKDILMITLLIYVPINIFLYFISETLTDLDSFKTYLRIIRILEGLFGIIVTMGIAYIVEKTTLSEENGEASWTESLNKAFSRWGSCIGTNILAGLMVLGLSFLLIIPGIIWSLYYTFVVQVVVLRDLGGKAALDYSKSLVKGRWWEVFGVLFAVNILLAVIGVIIGLISAFLPDLAGILTDTMIDIVGAFFTVATTVYFLNLDSMKI